MEFVELNLSPDASDPNDHVYTSRREGDWIIFTCPTCKGHERRLNWRTGEMKVIGNTHATHRGFHAPIGVDHTSLNIN